MVEFQNGNFCCDREEEDKAVRQIEAIGRLCATTACQKLYLTTVIVTCFCELPPKEDEEETFLASHCLWRFKFNSAIIQIVYLKFPSLFHLILHLTSVVSKEK